MFRDASQFPYSESVFAAKVPNASEIALDNAATMLPLVSSASTIEVAFKRPCCRDPTLTVGLPMAGASTIPEEEFPTTAAQCLIALR